MNRKILLLIVAVFLTTCLLIVLVITNWSFLTRDVHCTEKETMENYDFNAVIIKKYLDYKNHNYNTLIIKDVFNGREFNLYFINEKSGFYNAVFEQDTIYKESSSLTIINITQKKEFYLQYDCN